MFALLALASLASGCGGANAGRQYVPATSSVTNPLVRWGAISLPACSSKTYYAPGRFTLLTALGTFTGNSFSGSGMSLWATVYFAKGRNRLPIIQLPNIKTPYTAYYGTFKLNNGTLGCFYLAKVHYKGVSFDGASAAVPNVRNYGTGSPVAEGPLVISVGGIGAKSGSGTVTLKAASGGKVVASGTVKINGSRTVK